MLSFLIRFSVLFCFVFTLQAGTPAANPADIELRVQRLENTLSSSGLLDLFQRLENLQRQVTELQGELEVQNHQLKKLSARQDTLFKTLDKRITTLEETLKNLQTQAATTVEEDSEQTNELNLDSENQEEIIDDVENIQRRNN